MKKSNKKEMSPLLKLILKLSLLTFMVFAVIFYSDYKGYFNPEKANDHTVRKWNSFYDLNSKGIDIDVMLFGNSHLYTGINPKNLSLNLGANAFIFASPGTITADYYYSLQEAIKTNKPKLVIVETYGMNEFNPHELDAGKLSNQIVSFSARKDVGLKLASTPHLFAVDNYIYAWSTTIRNHDYIFTNKEQLDRNKTLIKNPPVEQLNNPKLYLGRYVRFTSGIEKEVLDKYNTEGAPIKGEEFEYSKSTKLYANKIIELCEKENIKLLFLTLPMYTQHISNYSAWENKLAELFEQTSSGNWLNLQTKNNYQGFDAFAFENTYNESQHMTYNGSILATYKLANYIKDSLQVDLPNRSADMNWHRLYYGDEGYFENYLPATNDSYNKLIASNKQISNVSISNLVAVKAGNNSIKLIAKIPKSAVAQIGDFNKTKLNLVLQYELNGTLQNAQIELKYDNLYLLNKEVIYTNMIKDINLKDVVTGELVLK